MTIEFKPCPSCKSNNLTISHLPAIQMAQVRCINCGTHGPQRTSRVDAHRLWNEMPRADEMELARLIHDYYMKEIGVLMHQAQYWMEHNKPKGVQYRILKADALFQVVVLMQRFWQEGWMQNPFKEMQRYLSAPFSISPGPYPPTPELHDYRDPVFVAEKIEELRNDSR